MALIDDRLAVNMGSRTSIDRPLGPEANSQSGLLQVLLKEALPQKGFECLDPSAESLAFPRNQFERVMLHLQGDKLRKGGIRTFDTRAVLGAADVAEVLDSFSSGNQMWELLPASVATRRLARILYAADMKEGADEPKLYRAMNALSYAFTRQFGWIDPLDLGWLCADHLGRTDYDETDSFGAFHALNPLSLDGYVKLEPGFYGSGADIFRALGVDLLDPSVALLAQSAVVLEINPLVFSRQIPGQVGEAKTLIIRNHRDGHAADYEVISPLLASDALLDAAGNRFCKVKAVLRASR
ncbi:MAG: hypothetical protein K1X79_12370 [Oligoflexia bacterium]|nr:hypothetical protein [Oligoflexia bacterium]